MIFSLLFGVKAQAMEVCGQLKQGEAVILKEYNAKVFSFSSSEGVKTYKTDDGMVIMALPRDCESSVKIISYDEKNNKIGEYDLNIETAKWDIQRVDGVKQKKVTPEKRHEEEILREQKDVRKALTKIDGDKYWHNGFILPLKGRISGNFGNQRIFNGIPKNPHSGTDIAVPQGTPVRASSDGKVTLNGKDYFYTGNMVVIDHGFGLQTIYAHLQDSTVKEGNVVKKGDIIGYVGKTGRATGPHLHWGASLHNIRFRPHSLIGIEDKCREYN